MSNTPYSVRSESLVKDDVLLFQKIFLQHAVGAAHVEAATGKFLQVSPRFAQILGVNLEEIFNIPFHELINLHEKPTFEVQMSLLAEGKVSEYSKEIRFQYKGLLEKRLRLTICPLGTPGEKLHSFVAIIQDIAKRKRGEVKHQNPAKELKALNELSKAVSTTLSFNQAASAALSGVIKAVHPDIAFLFLREDDRLVLKELLPPAARTLMSIIPEHRVGECMCGLAVREGRPLYSYNIYTDSRCTWDECKKAGFMSFAALPLKYGGKIIGVIGLASKTKRKFQIQHDFLETLASQVSTALSIARLLDAVQQQLAELKRLTAILESTPDFVSMATTDQKLTYLNRAGRKMAGWEEGELLEGKSITDMHSASVFQRIIQDGLPTAIATGHWEGETSILHRLGHEVPVSQVILAHRSPEGTVEYFSTIIRDISERKRAEAERVKLHEQLLQARKMESMGRLAGGVAHDFNNMLQAIIGNTALILEELPTDHPIRTDLEEIEKSAYRSSELTKRLLAFARKQPIAPKVIDLNHTVAGMLRMLQRLIGEDVQLAWLPGPNLWPVKVDPNQVDQILANLCVNARDAIEGGGVITIETENVTLDDTYVSMHQDCLPGDYVMLSVSDTGIGMSEEIKSHLFEPFFTTKDLGKGTGLGLATVFGSVKQNRGLINVYSEPGKGTTFKIYLPREMSALPEDMVIGQKHVSGGSETILLVEDEEQILQLGKKMMENFGYRVHTARSPMDALKIVEQFTEPIDLLITDVVMPGMNGKELHKELKARYPHLKCLFMSGYTGEVIIRQGILEQGVHFLQKPFTHISLAIKVREMLDQSI